MLCIKTYLLYRVVPRTLHQCWVSYKIILPRLHPCWVLKQIVCIYFFPLGFINGYKNVFYQLSIWLCVLCCINSRHAGHMLATKTYQCWPQKISSLKQCIPWATMLATNLWNFILVAQQCGVPKHIFLIEWCPLGNIHAGYQNISSP